MTWINQPLTSFDCESTGVDVETDHIVTAAVVTIRPAVRGVVREQTLREWLLAVEVDIPDEAVEVHHITTEYARAHGDPPAHALDLIAGELSLALRAGGPLIAMNAAYDLTLLDRNLRRYGLPTLEDRLGGPIRPVIDPMVLDRQIDRYRPGKKKLTNLCESYGVRIGEAHNATADALAAARLAWEIDRRSRLDTGALKAMYGSRRFPDRVAKSVQSLARLSLDQLHDAQVQWRAEQTDNFGQYLRQQANQVAAELERLADDPSPEALEKRGELELNVTELRERIDTLDGSWPVRPYRPELAEQMEVPVP